MEDTILAGHILYNHNSGLCVQTFRNRKTPRFSVWEKWWSQVKIQTANLATTVTEVSMEEIVAKGATTVGQALEFLPGVFVQSGGKGDVHVSIRGFEQRQVKILIDGVPARENYFGTVDLSMLPADMPYPRSPSPRGQARFFMAPIPWEA